MALTDSERTLVKEALALIERETANNEDSLVLKGFGTFSRKQKAAKVGRNPRTNQPVQIPSKSVLHFKPSPSQAR